MTWKYTVYVVLFLLFGACTKGKQNEKVETKEEVESTEQVESKTIAVLNFEELQKRLSERDDQLLVVNFWATWCKPCIEELPLFEDLNREGNQELEVILVSLDLPSKLESQLRPFVEKHKLESEVILLNDPHENKWIPLVDESWSGAIPATLMLKGEKRSFFEKSFNEEELKTEVSNFLNKAS